MMLHSKKSALLRSIIIVMYGRCFVRIDIKDSLTCLWNQKSYRNLCYFVALIVSNLFRHQSASTHHICFKCKTFFVVIFILVAAHSFHGYFAQFFCCCFALRFHFLELILFLFVASDRLVCDPFFIYIFFDKQSFMAAI